jgi:uncharacterized membrane protein
MARRFSIKPVLTIRGRQFKGLRGYAGKPFHPPLTDFPVVAYVLVAVFDLVSFIKGSGESVARDFFVSGTHMIVAGAIVSVAAAGTGFWDWLRSTEKGTQARRTANFHMAVMLTVTGVVIVDILVRLAAWDEGYATSAVLILSLLAGGLVALGAAYGGALVFDYGFNVETSGDHPAYHVSEEDVYPGQD